MRVTIACTIAMTVLLQGCTEINVASISERNAKGKDVDQVVSELKLKGLVCSQEYKTTVVNTGEKIGRVNCAVQENAVFCPESYQISVSFDLKTRKVLALGKFSQTNCF